MLSFDTAAFPMECVVTAELENAGWRVRVRTREGKADLIGVTSVFYRRPRPFGFPAGMSEPEERFARIEARFGLGGLFAALPARWVPGAPGRVADGEYKPLQLATAVRCGLPVLPTLLTNDPKAARRFAEEQDHVGCGAVYKTLMHKVVADDGQARLIYTTPVDSESVNQRIGITMHQFQANLAAKKLFDVRLVATRHGQIAVAIHAGDPQAHQDFRTGYGDLVYEVVDVPEPITIGCRAYLRALGLELGVFDFCATEAGWYFLECGPGAQWAWLQEETGAPISSLVADALTEESP
ncbi:hypothetical protein SAMN02745673_02208 [Marinactinospora thermotolerans DSM 45154]|uniref:ATP-grasp ribosomal peptide maturase, SAV_5884 family n=1 Tax=Marinactinospora thermotolerans DSM 45154 TaxID=1122192 RepID=A0A1T4QFJ8_9ACTN|nr:hypothetical protein SAMN02745673_02208 [Marinactinospora thermotolerans DSM 45154]